MELSIVGYHGSVGNELIVTVKFTVAPVVKRKT